MSDSLWIDLETRSRCDLLKYGLYNYAAHPSTEIVIASYAVGMGPIERWQRFGPSTPVIRLQNLLRDPKVEVRAHSAAFERLLLKHVWKIDIPAARFHCTAFQARASALPASLEDLGRALTAKLRKDPRGHELIRLLSIPREDGSFNEDAKLYAEFSQYCDRDVGAMRVASLMLPALTEEARAIYTANEIINDRGLPIDGELCEWAVRYADEERAEAETNVVRLTEGACLKARGETLTDWLYDHLPARAQKLMDITKRRMVARTSEPYDARTLDEATREAIFALAEEDAEGFSEEALGVLEANDAVMASSVHKFKSMLATCSTDGRLRGAFIGNGAAGTGRFSSHGAQLHNFPRLTAKDPEAVRKTMSKHGTLPGPVLEVLKSMLRPAIWPGAKRRIVRADWASIEARVLPWLTARASALDTLDAFRDPARDLYLEDARACGLNENRNAGKVVRLSLGYGGAERALAAMSKGYKVKIERPLRPVVLDWRRANPWAAQWWAEMDRSARRALGHPAPLWHEAGLIGWRRAAEGEVPGLRMLLPSGRLLYYPLARSDEAGIGYLRAAWKPKADAIEWPRARLWGGMLAENATQAAAADLLRAALVTTVGFGLPVIGHCHDELIGEAHQRDAKALARELHRHMLAAPEWANGLPLAVETEVSARYKK